jgi:hypothetical protein
VLVDLRRDGSAAGCTAHSCWVVAVWHGGEEDFDGEGAKADG